METWSTAEAAFRIRADDPASGAVNMRRDLQMLEAVEAGDESATLRLYAWRPACISLGHHQPEEELDLAAARRDGLDVVRRPTGGGAILHDDELTYAFAAPWAGGPGVRRVRSAYDLVADALVRALQSVGVAAARGGSGGAHAALCFSESQGHEIHVGGDKLVGSALRAGRRGFLIHGSLPRGPSHRRLSRYALPGAGALNRSTDLSACGVSAERVDLLCEAIGDELQRAWRRARSEVQA